MAKGRYWIYIIELDPAVLTVRKFRAANPDSIEGMACLYVGQTATTPEERFAQHTRGYKSNRYVKKFGRRLRPDLYQQYNPVMTRENAEAMEAKLAKKLRVRGYAVWFH